MNPLAYTGLAVGILFGFALQRGRFCMNSAFRDIVLLKDFTLIKAVGAAILVQMIGFSILALTGAVTLNPKPLFWGANITGGLIFGIGMVLAGGCASGITYRVGEGMVGAMSAVVGFGLAGLMTAMGVLKPIKDYLQSSTKIMTAEGTSLTLANIFGIEPTTLMLLIAAFSIGIWVILASRKKADAEDDFGSAPPSLWGRIFTSGWGWRRASSSAWWSSSLIRHQRPRAATTHSASPAAGSAHGKLLSFRTPSSLGRRWRSWELSLAQLSRR